MDILNSNWLIKMLEKSSQTPHGRLLSLFDILEDWLNAPNVAPNVASAIREAISEPIYNPEHAKILQDYLTLEAAKAGVAMPEMLANQLYFMAISAIEACLQTNIHAGAVSDYKSHDASSHSTFNHAKSAANALILAQTKKEFYIAKSSAYAIAASFVAILVIAGSLLMLNLYQASKLQQIANLVPALQSPVLKIIVQPAQVASQLTASPDQTAAIMAQLELMRHGNCQLIEAIQLPDSQKGIYLNMVVNGQVSTDPQEQKIAMELIKKTRCNYTPLLMANSK